MVSINKGGKLTPSRKASLEKLAQTVCPGGTCCITIWPAASAPTAGLIISPCTPNVLFVSGDAIVAGCNVVAAISTLPTYVSSGCSLNQQTTTSVTPAAECNGAGICILGGSNGVPTLNIGPSGCTNIGPCNCNIGAPSCGYPTSAFVVPAFSNSVTFNACHYGQQVVTTTFDFTTTNQITLTNFNFYGYCVGGGCPFSLSICLGGNTATCVADNLPYTTIVSGNTGNDNLCTSANFSLPPGAYSMTVYFAAKQQNNLLTQNSGYSYPNAGITIAPSAAGTGDVPSDGNIGFQATFQSSDGNC